MDLDIVVNGTTLHPGRQLTAGQLTQAGLVKLPRWRRLWRRLPPDLHYWEADNPHVLCFAGQLEIFACHDRYLDPDRRWGTALLLGERDDTLRRLDIRINDGRYAAGNYYDCFLDVARERFGPPQRNGRRQTIWLRQPLQIEASLSADAMNAIFRLTWRPGAES